MFDLTGAYVEAFYNPATDTILNPLDARCPRWSVFDECRDEAEFTAAAEALALKPNSGEPATPSRSRPNDCCSFIRCLVVAHGVTSLDVVSVMPWIFSSCSAVRSQVA